MIRLARTSVWGAALLWLAACGRDPEAVAERRVRALAPAMQAATETLRACVGQLPADSAAAPPLPASVCECAAHVGEAARFRACGRGQNFIAFVDSTGWAALAFSPAGPPAVWPVGDEDLLVGRAALYMAGADPLGGPWYLLHLNPTVD